MKKIGFEHYRILSNESQKLILGGYEDPGGGGSKSCAGTGPSKTFAYCDSQGKTTVCCWGLSGSGIDFNKAECVQAEGPKAVQYCSEIIVV